MAIWILNRPAAYAHPTELQVAELLAPLPDTWTIRWGFFYHDNAGVQREGDFLVLGPDGGLLVLEAKSGALDQFPTTGRWDTDEGDNPISQLHCEWKAVVNELNAAQGDRPRLHVQKALALPHVEIPVDVSSYHDLPRLTVVSRNELKDFVTGWKSRMPEGLDPTSRAIFMETYAKGATPEAIRHFADQADRALLRHTEGNYELLDLLRDNRQFVVKGGPGSGKTWLAFEQACRWAEQGQKVLFLCYNLALTDFLREMVRKAQLRGRPPKEAVQVMSWEELARMLLRKAGIEYQVPEEDPQKTDFYTRTLPELMAQAVHENVCQPEFDALIVDEAQDHDTGMLTLPPGWEGPGWWGIYWRLLHHGAAAPLALFYDPAQRPVFRNTGGFDPDPLYRALKGNPVRIQLQKSVRYTWPVLKFLKSLRTPASAPLVDALHQRGSLPQGPAVEVHTATREETPEKAAAIICRWLDQGLCEPDEILILSQYGRPEKSALANHKILAGHFLVDFLHRQSGCISRTSVNKAKGLDSRAVLLIDFEPFEQLSDSAQISYFMGASRARQLLGIVHRTG